MVQSCNHITITEHLDSGCVVGNLSQSKVTAEDSQTGRSSPCESYKMATNGHWRRSLKANQSDTNVNVPKLRALKSIFIA